MIIDYLIIGHIAADITPSGFVLGGTVAYAAHTAQAFGLNVAVLTSARQDEPLLKQIHPAIRLKNIAAESTTIYENIYTAEGRVQYLRAVAAHLQPEHIPGEWRSARLVHLAPIANEVSPEMVYLFPNSRIIATPQGWMRRADATQRIHFYPWQDDDVLRQLDLMVISEEDIIHSPNLEQTCAAKTQRLVITRGDKPGTVYQHGMHRTFDVFPVKPVDLTGAGDIFTASLVCAWDRCGDFYQALQAAARLAAYSVQQHGLASVPPVDIVDKIVGC